MVLHLILGLSSYLKDFIAEYVWLEYSGIAGTVGLILLSMLMIIGMWVMNRNLRQSPIEIIVDV